MRITGDSTSRRCTTALILRLVHQDRLTELGHPALTMAFALLIFRRIRSTQAFPLLIPPLSDCMLSAHPTLTNMNPMGSGVGLYPRAAAQARLPANRATTGAQAVPPLTPAIAVEHPRKSWLAATHLSAVTLSALFCFRGGHGQLSQRPRVSRWPETVVGTTPGTKQKPKLKSPSTAKVFTREPHGMTHHQFALCQIFHALKGKFYVMHHETQKPFQPNCSHPYEPPWDRET